MTRRQLFERLHMFFLGAFQGRYGREPTVSELVKIIGKSGGRSDVVSYYRYIREESPRTPTLDEMQRMCSSWRAAGLRGIDIRISLVLEGG